MANFSQHPQSLPSAMDDDLDPADADALDDRSTAREAAKVARSQALGRDGVIASKHHHQWIS